VNVISTENTCHDAISINDEPILFLCQLALRRKGNLLKMLDSKTWADYEAAIAEYEWFENQIIQYFYCEDDFRDRLIVLTINKSLSIGIPDRIARKVFEPIIQHLSKQHDFTPPITCLMERTHER
jgi:hypothetical protein